MRPISAAVFSLLLALSMTVSSLASAHPPQAPPPPTTGQMLAQAGATVAGGPSKPTRPEAMSNAERAVYAAREASSRNAGSFRGGDEVVLISSGTVVLVLVVVIVVLLLR